MKRLDDSTLEAFAEAICGAGKGAGGGYESPGPYRSKSQVCDFFRRAGVDPSGMSSTRKWFVLESLQAINGTSQLDSVLKRLASPKEYRGDAAVTQTVRAAAAAVLGPDRVLEIEPDMGGEDFSLLAQEAPGCFYRLGVTPPGQPLRDLHSSNFDIDESALPVGAATLAAAALRLLRE